jgi:chemotaxis protein CheD
MKEIFVEAFKKNVKIINIGEYYATDKEEGIATVLGSCVCACIYEEDRGIGGMNHFLLPGDFRSEEIFLSPVARYGMFAMELLMGELIKLNVDRNKLKAKVFGGAQVVKGLQSEVGPNNIKFIKTFLDMEGIPIISSDLGGESARKIFFFPKTGKAMVKKIDRNMTIIANIEDKFFDKVQREI